MAEIHNAQDHFICLVPSDLWAALDRVQLPANFQPIAKAFRINIESAFQVATIPFTLMFASAVHRRWQAILSAQRIRSLKSDVDVRSREEFAQRTATERLKEDMDRPDFKSINTNEAISTLETTLLDEDFAAASEELLRQIVVMSWSAIEVLANDLLISLLNQRPAVAAKTFASKRFGERFGKNLPLTALETLGFDLKDKMGGVFQHLAKLDSIEDIREIYGIVFDSAELSERLKSEELWLLYQRRNLIVHRCSIVDGQYLDKTPESLPLGSKLNVNRDQAEEGLQYVADTGALMLSTAVRHL